MCVFGTNLLQSFTPTNWILGTRVLTCSGNKKIGRYKYISSTNLLRDWIKTSIKQTIFYLLNPKKVPRFLTLAMEVVDIQEGSWIMKPCGFPNEWLNLDTLDEWKGEVSKNGLPCGTGTMKFEKSGLTVLGSISIDKKLLMTFHGQCFMKWPGILENV